MARTAGLLGTLVALSLAGCSSSSGQDAFAVRDGVSPSSSAAVEPAAPAFSHHAKATPPGGKVKWLNTHANNVILKRNIANGAAGTLQITVPTGRESYFAKLVQVSPGNGDTLGVSLRPGQTATVKVPLNGNFETTYVLRYSAGTTWYGYKYLFGPDGSYAVADDDFAFSEGTGWSVRLILQPAGNLSTSGIGYEDF